MLTLEDLYKTLDWSGADAALAHWEAQHPVEEGSTPEEYREGFRYALLEQALWGEAEAKDFARNMLFKAGVWVQLKRFCNEHRGEIDALIQDGED